MSATVLIPAYNEAATIEAVVRVAREGGFPVVVVDDGSTDGTADAAARAGATVIQLKKNSGKGGAYAEGLKHVHTPYVILLDADLVGLRKDHLQALLQPVLEGEADMTVGVFRGGRLLTDIGNRITPFLSGQRALATERLRRVKGLAEARYDVELLITQAAKAGGWRTRYLPLTGLSQVMKEEKRGFLKGALHRMRMYFEVLRYALKAKTRRDR